MKLLSLLAVFALAIPANAQTFNLVASDGTKVTVVVEPVPKVVTMVIPQAPLPMPAMAVPVTYAAPSFAVFATRPAVMFARPEPVMVHRVAHVATWFANRPRLVTACP